MKNRIQHYPPRNLLARWTKKDKLSIRLIEDPPQPVIDAIKRIDPHFETETSLFAPATPAAGYTLPVEVGECDS